MIPEGHLKRHRRAVERATAERLQRSTAVAVGVRPARIVVKKVIGIRDLAGVSEILLKLAIEPDFVRRLMDVCLVTARDFARAQIEAGSDVMGVGDAICSQISPGMYEEFVLPLHRELFDYIHSLGALVKLHICGNITRHLTLIGTSGADIVDIDWMVDMDAARRELGDRVTLCGNLDPVSAVQDRTAHEVFELSRKLVEKRRGERFILSGGCEITVGTPHENLKAMRRACG